MYQMYLGFLGISATISAALAVYVWRRRRAPGALAFAAMMLALFIWACVYIYELLFPGLSTRIFANDICYIAIVAFPLLFFLFSLKYTGNERIITLRNRILLGIIPAVTLILVWTSNWHGLMWSGAYVEIYGPYSIIVENAGAWFWVHLSYSYVLLLAGIILLLRRFFQPPFLNRSQVIAIIIGVLVPAVWNIMYVFDLLPGPRVDFTPSAFTVTGIAMALGLFRFGLFDVLPVARATVIELMSDGVIMTDKEGRLVDLNPVANRIFENKLSRLASKPVEQVFSRYPEVLQKFRAINGGEASLTTGEGEEQRFYGVTITPLNNASGDTLGRIMVIRDVTERRRQEELMKRTRELESANRAKSEFLANMSHELRTPLNAILGFSELMLDEIPGQVNAEQKQCLNDIYNSGRHLLDIVKDVLDLSRLESGRLEIWIDDVILGDVIQSAIQTMKPILDKNEHQLEVSIEKGLQVRADAERLKQVVVNLLSNATKYTAPGGKIRIEAYREGELCRVNVIDSGIGIREEDKSRIFDAFTQAETLPGREREGTGLGLTLCKEFLELFGGRIWVESEPGKGSQFSFTLLTTRN